MAEPFLAEIRLFPYNFVPRGWFRCEGQTLQINQFQALFSLLGTTYGGDGVTTFALPDLRGRAPVHPSSAIPLGQSAGEASHTLLVSEMPAHTHHVSGSNEPAVEVSPQNNAWATNPDFYGPAESPAPMNDNALSNAGGGMAHNNMQPYLALCFCIAYVGIYPPHN